MMAIRDSGGTTKSLKTYLESASPKSEIHVSASLSRALLNAFIDMSMRLGVRQ